MNESSDVQPSASDIENGGVGTELAGALKAALERIEDHAVRGGPHGSRCDSCFRFVADMRHLLDRHYAAARASRDDPPYDPPE